MPNIKVNDVIMLDSLSSDCILQSLEKAGLEPEYQCRDGHCGSCRCKLVEGQVEYTGFAMAYLQPDEILPCICRATSDIKLTDVKYTIKDKRA